MSTTKPKPPRTSTTTITTTPTKQKRRNHRQKPANPNPNSNSNSNLNPNFKRSLDPLVIPFSVPYWKKMSGMVHGMDLLRVKGYKVEDFSEEELLTLRRCGKCRARTRGKNRKREKKGEESEIDEKVPLIELSEQTTTATTAASREGTPSYIDIGIGTRDDATLQVTVTEAEAAFTKPKDTATAEKAEDKENKKKNIGACKFHTGTVVAKYYTCCQSHVSKPGCVSSVKHTPQEYAAGELEQEWKLYRTPPALQKNYRKKSQRRRAVSLDCEMGSSKNGDPELIRVTAVDYFTGQTLVDSLVYPSVSMLHFNTRYSGVNRGMLERARSRNQCLMGRDKAREQLWKFVGPETILVMHGGESDLMSLRWIHGRVIDTLLVEESRKRPIQKRSLKHLAEVILNTHIQKGKKGHNSLEDALASRALLHWYVVNL